MDEQDILKEIKQVKSLYRVELNYETDKGDFFKILDKKLAETIIGFSISDDDFHNKIELECGGLTDYINVLQPTIHGVMTTPSIYLLKKEALKDCIEIFTYIYNNYDDYYGAYAFEQVKKFCNSCLQYKYMQEKISGNANKKARERSSKSGYVYIMKCMGTYKIGKSNNCERLGEYTNLPEEPEYILVEYVDDMSDIEKKIHEQFSNVRRRHGQCEWFDLTKEDLLIIKEMIEPHIIEHKPTAAYNRYYRKIL